MASRARWSFRARWERSGRNEWFRGCRHRLRGIRGIHGLRDLRGMNPALLVFGAGLLAGTMNASPCGGSFVSLPALISVGVPSVQANASSTVGLFPAPRPAPGRIAMAWDRSAPSRSRLCCLTTVAGGGIGALLLLWTPSKTFDFVLPWLLLIATLTLGFGRRLGESLRRRWHIRPSAVLTIQLGLGIYGGYLAAPSVS